MDAYGKFAKVYDLFMEDIPYDEWCAYLVALLREKGILDGLVLELGAGTGNVTERLAKAGYDMIGLDSSPDMLAVAAEKREKSGLPILYLHQDMREFELYGTVRAVVALCDTMNYLLTPEDFIETLKLVNNYLDPGGYFIFDLKTAHYFRGLPEVNGASEEHAAYLWENWFDEETSVNEYELTLFEEQENGLFERDTEYHAQRAYRLPEIRKMAKTAGMKFVTAYEAMTKNPAGGKSDRIYVILQEQGKRAENE